MVSRSNTLQQYLQAFALPYLFWHSSEYIQTNQTKINMYIEMVRLYSTSELKERIHYTGGYKHASKYM